MKRSHLAFASCAFLAFGLAAPTIAAPPPEVTLEQPSPTGTARMIAGEKAGAAPVDRDVSWRANGMRGIVRYAAENNGCRSFTLLIETDGRLYDGTACRDGQAWRVQTLRSLRGPAAAADPGKSAGEGPAPPPPPPPPPPPAAPASPPPSAPPMPPPIMAPPPPPPSPTAAARPVTKAAPKTATRSLGGGGGATASGSAPGLGNGAGTPRSATGGVATVTTAVISELLSGQPRLARNGGAGVVLLSERPQDRVRNEALCRALYATVSTATRSEVEAGVRVRDGVVQELRPIYWMLRQSAPPGADRCAARVAAYDFARAQVLRKKLSLTGNGPYLAVLNADDSRAAVVDLGAESAANAELMVSYFKDAFSQEGAIWDPQRHEPTRSKGALTAFFGREVPLVSLPRLVLASALCPLKDSVDACRA